MGAAPAEKWQALINSAILGSERAGTAASDDLARVAMLSPYLRAGRKPRSDTEAALEACPSDDPVCGTEAGRHLEEILFGDQKAVLPEWCRAAEKAGLTAPFELIPDLLSKLPSIESQDVIQRVIGNRGHWLAMQNPEWAAHLTNDQGDPEEIWQTGSRKERLKLLQTLRRRDPARARELLPTTWSEETADDRVSLLSAFGDNLEAADEPLLESLLDDRSARVRALAAGLLSGIEGSALSLRMAERLRPLVAYTRTGLMKKKPRLELALPEAADKPMTHDGLEAKRQGNMGARAVLLSGIVANAPLSVWAEFGGTPADYIAAARAGDWLLPLVNGCAAAAARQRDRSWAEALLAHLIESNVLSRDDPLHDLRQEYLPLLLACLDRATAERLVMSALERTRTPNGEHQAAWFLEACDFAWSMALSRAVLDWLRRRLIKQVGGAQSMTDRVALRLSPTLAGEAAAGWPVESKDWTAGKETTVTSMTTTLQFRRDMLAALKP